VEIPYRGGDLSMVILLPGKMSNLKKMEQLLSPELLQSLSFRKTEMIVGLPKFKIESALQLGETLSAMGAPLAFSDSADFSGITKEEPLKLNEVIQKTFVEVAEKGTEAAAATAVVQGAGAGIQQIPIFVADHPFLFLIRENSTGSILFIGRLTDPDLAGEIQAKPERGVIRRRQKN
jgi:serpin B